MISNSGTTTLGLYDFKRQMDLFGGVDYFRAVTGGYLPNSRVMLDTGVIVRNFTSSNLTNNPNIDMSGWVVVEDILTVNPRAFGAKFDGITDDSNAFQLAADALKDGGVFRADGVSKLTRQANKHTDLYGTEGRSYGRLTLNGGQPCIIFREKKNITIDLRGSELFTEVYGQGIIDLYKCENVTIIGGKQTGGAYIRSTSEYKMPPIDGLTGHAEKGTSTTGFNTTTLSPDIGTSRNNQFITQNETTGGYGGQFPQFDGTTSTTWGVWRDGQLGGQGYAICVIGGKNILITQTESHGFNGGSVILGLQRSLDGSTSYGRISTEETRALSPSNVVIYQNHFHNNYIGGVHSERSTQVYVEKNFIADMGHPDASIAHTFVDPGYGFSTSRAMPTYLFEVTSNTFMRCMRKGMDAHNGSNFLVTKNKIWGTKFHGIGIAMDDAVVDEYYQPYYNHIGIIRDNDIQAHEIGIYYANGSFGRKSREDAKLKWTNPHIVIEGNLVRSTNGFYFNYGHSPFKIINNTFEYEAPFKSEKTATGAKNGIYLGSLGRGLAAGYTITGNTFRNSKDGNFQNGIQFESSPKETKAVICTDNFFDITPWFYADGANSQFCHNDVGYRSGLASTPISYTGGQLLPSSVISSNTVKNDFHHTFTVGGGGTGVVAYPRIDIDGRVGSVQLLNGGTGYNGTITVTILNKAKSTGATFTGTATGGVITAINVVNSGRFYRNTYTYELTAGLLEYDMKLTSGSACLNSAINKRTDASLYVVSANGSAVTTPFLLDSSVYWGNALRSNQQYLHIPAKTDGGAVSFWFKIPSGQPTGDIVLIAGSGSADGANQPSGTITATLVSDGFTLNVTTSIDGATYVAGTKLSFNTPYHYVFNAGVFGGNIVLGANATTTGGFGDVNFAFVKIHRAMSYTLNECNDLFQENRALFGK